MLGHCPPPEPGPYHHEDFSRPYGYGRQQYEYGQFYDEGPPRPRPRFGDEDYAEMDMEWQGQGPPPFGAHILPPEPERWPEEDWRRPDHRPMPPPHEDWRNEPEYESWRGEPSWHEHREDDWRRGEPWPERMDDEWRRDDRWQEPMDGDFENAPPPRHLRPPPLLGPPQPLVPFGSPRSPMMDKDTLRDFFGCEPPPDVWKAINEQYNSQGARPERAPLLGSTPMQNNFNRHLRSFGPSDEIPPAPEPLPKQVNKPAAPSKKRQSLLATSKGTSLNQKHPAYDKEQLEELQKIDGPDRLEPIFDSPYSLAIFDKAYENSIWDYDPKFTWDYLPGTKRGSKNAELRSFVYKSDYIEEEFAWKKWERKVEHVWRTNYVPKVLEQQKLIELGIDPKTPAQMTTEELPQNKMLNYFEENVGFPDDYCSVEYCSVCDSAFTSVIPSMTHYFSERHVSKVRNYFVDSLLDNELVKYDDLEKQWFDGVIRRMFKKYKTKPAEWFCSVCSVTITSLQQAKSHFKGMQHQRRSKGLPMLEKVDRSQKKVLERRCAPCGLTFTSQEEVKKHIHSRRHIQMVGNCAQNNIALPPGPSSKIGVGSRTKAMYAKAASGANAMPLGQPKPRAPNSAVFSGAAGMQQMSANTYEQNFYCHTCHKILSDQREYDGHMLSSEHLMRESSMAMRSVKGKAPVLPMGASGTQQKPKHTVQSLGFVPGIVNTAQGHTVGTMGHVQGSAEPAAKRQKALQAALAFAQQKAPAAGGGSWVKAKFAQTSTAQKQPLLG